MKPVRRLRLWQGAEEEGNSMNMARGSFVFDPDTDVKEKAEQTVKEAMTMDKVSS